MSRDIELPSLSGFLQQLESELSGLSRSGEPRGTTVVGVSGGADSIALLAGLDALREQTGLVPHVLHVNHQLRDSADTDANFVAEFADELGVGCEIVRADVRAIASEQGTGLEEAARKVRYRAFMQCAKQLGASLVAVAHHQDDQVETILHHIIRGTGLKGLEGIPRSRELCDGVTLIRPMLTISRSTILDFINEQQLGYREDETNHDNVFTRNRIRNELLPLIERDFNPQVRESLLRLSHHATDAQKVIDGQVGELLNRCCECEESTVRVRCDLLLNVQRSVVRSLMREVWIHQGWPRQKMGFDEWDSLADVVEGQLTGRDLPGGVNVSRRRAIMTLRRS
ncbi:MAG: tRNA lysidine(34) synthetase TilS [Planctomycetaceae bacterium]